MWSLLQVSSVTDPSFQASQAKSNSRAGSITRANIVRLSRYKTCTERMVVIGPGTSGHDVAQDFVNHGAKAVSLIQRNPIFFLSAESCEAIQLFLWKMEGLTTEEADLIGNSTPLAVIRTMSIGMTKAMAEMDKDTIAGLKKAGMVLNTGEDGYGLADYQLIYGGRYYLDQGASEMVVDGRIKIHSCEKGVKEIQQDAIVLENGSQVRADIIVLATGYHSNVETVEKILGSEVAQKLDSNFGRMDSENERAGWWRPTGQPGFWFMTGSFMWCRQYSLALALQIAAVEKGFNESHYGKK
uniref:FAD/NAD(P)-binding domain-containing protein n=1 Tax=Bionectria ochroleuca TaxID=29856 RepID=A0A8H7N5W4_BIOOC